jgi:prepilin-type N-terminal cleavage/methylation domain-containing protein
MTHKKGFTLIELLVVIAIIGILAAIGITAFGGAQGKARDAKRKGDIGSLNASLTLYYDNNNYSFPNQFADGTAANNAALASTSLAGASANATYGFALPKTPSNTNAGDYWYASNAATNSSKMALFTRLESKAAGTWFVSNSMGYSDEITVAAAATTVPLPSASTRTACADSAVAAAYYNVCLATPTMRES